MRAWTAAAALCFAAIAVGQTPPVPRLDPRLEAALLTWDRGDHATALLELEKLGASAPTDGALQLLITDELVKRKEYAAAEPFARRALGLLPDFPPAHILLGVSLLSTDRAEEAERLFRAAVARFQGTIDEPELVFNLGMACALQSKRLEAGDWFAKAIALKPKNALFRFSAAENDRNLQRFAQAEAGFRLAMTLEPRHADAGWKLAVTLAAQGRDGDAEPLFRTAIAAGPPASRQGASYEYGVFLFERGRATEALPLLEALTKAKPDHRMAWNYLARTLRALGRKDAAAAAISHYQALQKEADRSETRYLLGLIQAQLSGEAPGDGKQMPERR